MIRLLFPSRIFCTPVLYGITEKLVESQFKPVQLDEHEAVARLLNGEAEMAFLSPLTYAMSGSRFKIVKDFTISSFRGGRNMLLFFRENLARISTLYVSGNNHAEGYVRFVSELVLKEFLSLQSHWEVIAFQKMDLPLLNQYPAILVEGDLAAEIFPAFENFIDLSEEWSIHTELPLVQLLLCAGPAVNNLSVLEPLRISLDVGRRNLSTICHSWSGNRPKFTEAFFQLMNDSLHYGPSPEVGESLQQVFSYLFYYNRVEYLPDAIFLE